MRVNALKYSFAALLASGSLVLGACSLNQGMPDLIQAETWQEQNTDTPVADAQTDVLTVEEVPPYSGSPYVEINQNEPEFSKDELTEKYGILKCGDAQKAAVAPEDQITCRRQDYEWQILVSDRQAAARKYPGAMVVPATIDEIMLLYIKGDSMSAGGGMSFLASPWVMCIMATVMLGIMVSGTINVDKNSGWLKLSAVLPVSRRKAVSSKYLLFLLLSAAGMAVGSLISLAVTAVTGNWDMENILVFLLLAPVMALLPGSVIIPCVYILGEEKSYLGLILSYPAAAAVFVALVLLLPNLYLAASIAIALGVLCFGASWIFFGKYLAKRDIG